MSDPIEAAARMFCIMSGDQVQGLTADTWPSHWDTDDFYVEDQRDGARKVLLAFLRDAIGCPDCKGHGERELGHHYETGVAVVFGDCPAEHVEIPFLGETIFADPDKCEWRCDVHLELHDRHPICDPDLDSPYMARTHDNCGWQPKWDAIKGDET